MTAFAVIIAVTSGLLMVISIISGLDALHDDSDRAHLAPYKDWQVYCLVIASAIAATLIIPVVYAMWMEKPELAKLLKDTIFPPILALVFASYVLGFINLLAYRIHLYTENKFLRRSIESLERKLSRFYEREKSANDND